MIPLGEVITQIYSEIFWLERDYAIVETMGATLLIGMLVILGMEYGLDTIGVLDSTVAAFALFGGVISVWSGLTGKTYIPRYLRAWASFGAPLLIALGAFALYDMFISGNYPALFLLALGLLMALLFDSRTKERLEIGKRLPSRYR